MFFRAPTLDRAREYSVPLIEEYLHRKVIPCPDAAEHQFPSFFSLQKQLNPAIALADYASIL